MPNTMRVSRGPLSTQTLLLSAAVILALYFAREVLIPVALALTINFLLTPLVMAVQRIGLRRVPAVVLVTIASTALVCGIGWVVARQLIVVAEDLPQYRDNIHEKATAVHSPLGGSIGQAIQGVQAVLEEFSGNSSSASSGTASDEAQKGAAARRRTPDASRPLPVSVVEPPENSLRYMRALIGPVVKPFALAVIVLVLTLYMLVKQEDLRNRLLLLAGMTHLNVMNQALEDANSRISRYLIMNFVVNASYGVLFGIGLYLLGVPYATLWAVLAGILRVVPYVGTLAGAALPFALSLAAFTTLWQPLLVLALFAVLEFVISNFIEPWLYGAHTGISSLALLMSAIFWGLLWGWPGLVLSTPLTVVLIVTGRYVPQLSFLHILLGDDAELAPEARFYERLLAMDQTEAHGIAEAFLEGKPLVELYDKIVLPALSLAEQERHKGVLDGVRAQYLFQSATELIAELTEYRLDQPCADRKADSQPMSPKPAPVVCLPASDEADEIAGTMLAQLLEQCGHKTLLLPPAALTDEILKRLAEEPDTIICISALPPFAFAAARSVTSRVRKHLPNNRVMIGLWDAAVKVEELRERFGNTRPDIILTSLAATLLQINDWHSAESGIWSMNDLV